MALVFTDCHGGRGQQGPMIIDRAGRLVWFKPLSDHGTPKLRAFNVRAQEYRGQPVLTWWQGAVVAAHGRGHYEVYDQHYRQLTQVQAGNGYVADLHEFRLTNAGTALLTAYGQAQGALPSHSGKGTRRGSYLYGVVQEVDVASGEVLLQWRSDEHVNFAASYHTPPPADPRVPWDYFHVNSIAVDPADGNLVISARNTWACYKVHRLTGEVIWTLGGRDSDFEMGSGTEFAFQHDVTPHAGGMLTIFDNEAGPPRHANQSRGLVLAVDEQARRVQLVRQFLHDPPVLSSALGSVQALDAGGTFVGWGDSSYFTEYDSETRVILDAHLGSDVLSYRAFRSAWSGIPETVPQVAVKRSGAAATVFVSWNGSTAHRRWRVLGGGHRDGLSELARVTVDGFETRIAVAHTPPWLAVEALDSVGHSLARSDVVRA